MRAAMSASEISVRVHDAMTKSTEVVAPLIAATRSVNHRAGDPARPAEPVRNPADHRDIVGHVHAAIWQPGQPAGRDGRLAGFLPRRLLGLRRCEYLLGSRLHRSHLIEQVELPGGR